MPGRIPSQFIDELISRVDVVEIINRRVPLKKAGRDFQACCPFHDEKTPSFTVSQQKQFYHCFGCGAHGSAIGFLMEYDNLGFVEAVESLAESAGLEVPREAGYDQGPDLRPLYDLMEEASRFYQQQLRQHPEVYQAVDYLKHRGLTGEIAARFHLGFAPPGWDNLLSILGQDQAAIERLSQCGLTSEPESGKRYDRFRHRIVFPIRDSRGRVIGFGGRVLGDDKPKYLNSPETPLFHKGRELYGLYEARKANNKLQRLLVVEGYMDVVALAQYGILNAVATLGTATTQDHLELIFRTCSEVVFCFDGDRAGKDAAWKALQTTLPVMREGREARFLFLPDGEDPDTLVRKEGREAFEVRIDGALPLSEFLFQQLTGQVKMETIDGRAHLAELAKPYLERLPPGLFRRMMYQHLENLVGIRDGHLDTQSAGTGRASRQARQRQAVQRPTPIRFAIALLLDNPHLVTTADSVDDSWKQWQTTGTQILSQLLEIIRSQPTLNKAALLERWRDSEHFAHLNKLAEHTFTLPEMDQETELRDALVKLNSQFRKESRPLPGNLKPSELSETELDALKKRYPGTLPSETDDGSES
ncbi:MAG: DNA primase [Candidatus Thiodiazotropha sp. (ex Monitilora ramsayi)]|nr:DNA primase [Candidatus Thiodiazotropha sp. (ex Monitilora ramsayi)]